MSWEVLQGDCRELMKSLPAGSVDAIVADIPYGQVNRNSGGLRVLDKGNADIETFPASWAASEAARIGKTAYIWCGTEQVSDIRRAMVDAGMTTRLCIWHKTNPSPMNGESLWLSGLECCVFGRHPGAYFSRHCEVPIWKGPSQDNQEHPTQKPVWLMKAAIVASVPVGGMILDFCCGSGTTGVAAIELGRKFLGYELDPAYCEIARRRISEAVPLWAPEPVKVERPPELFA